MIGQVRGERKFIARLRWNFGWLRESVCGRVDSCQVLNFFRVNGAYQVQFDGERI